jgi:RNA polymerase sigma-70 factor (ECF subfamily)
MAEQFRTGRRSLEEFRNYLCFLARIQIAPLDCQLRAKLEASDIVQEVLLKAHAAREQLTARDDGATAAWLRRILANTLVDAIRRLHSGMRNVDLELSLESQLEQSSVRLEALLAAPASSEEERETHETQLLRLAGALGELPSDQRTAIELMHLHDCSVADISERMGKTPAAVGGLLRRGMKKLRELMMSDG